MFVFRNIRTDDYRTINDVHTVNIVLFDKSELNFDEPNLFNASRVLFEQEWINVTFDNEILLSRNSWILKRSDLL